MGMKTKIPRRQLCVKVAHRQEYIRKDVYVYYCTPVEAAENVESSVFSSVEIHAEDGGKDEQHHGKVEHNNHRSL